MAGMTEINKAPTSLLPEPKLKLEEQVIDVLADSLGLAMVCKRIGRQLKFRVQMADIMILCPIFGTAVPTGITTEMIMLDTLDFPLTMQCPACRKIHKWTRRDAQVEDQNAQARRWRRLQNWRRR